MEEFAKLLTDSLKSLRDNAVKPVVSTAVSVPVFDLLQDDDGASRWCDELEKLGETFTWSSYKLLVRGASSLVEEAKDWFSGWKPVQNTWDEFRTEISSLYPAKRNVSQSYARPPCIQARRLIPIVSIPEKRFILLMH